MNYILVYDIIKDIDITFWENFPLFLFLISVFVVYAKLERNEPLYFKIIIWGFIIVSFIGFTINGWSKSQNIIERIATQKYSIAEGRIERYIPSDNYNRKKGYFWVGQQKFVSETPYGFNSDLKLNSILLKNGYKVKIYHIGNRILKFWIEDQIPILTKLCNDNHSIACYELAESYYRGMMVELNLSKALNFYEKSCDGGDKKYCSYVDTVKNEIRYIKKEEERKALKRKLEIEEVTYQKPIYDMD